MTLYLLWHLCVKIYLNGKDLQSLETVDKGVYVRKRKRERKSLQCSFLSKRQSASECWTLYLRGRAIIRLKKIMTLLFEIKKNSNQKHFLQFFQYLSSGVSLSWTFNFYWMRVQWLINLWFRKVMLIILQNCDRKNPIKKVIDNGMNLYL